ncbi:MFS transporter [uncultured Endozoicomonas sp.]|uniref:MFS transporter n=1 Tax=uncultured Endozoicomonas sp. TaxID=432652 RepID=UPI002617B126|nr:MFS transporter [uncultured Endozoicomonas sp.]
MLNIETGKNRIPLPTLIAVWSISAVISLPGLAISPILGHLDRIFPHVSDSDLQMMTSLPSILIIPFILLSGHWGSRENKLILLAIGLTIFILSGASYFYIQSMNELLYVSLLLGVGAGLIIPQSTGLINDLFSGPYRIHQFGISSFITNLTLVVATALTGWVAEYDWHYPFIVYLFPVLPLSLLYFLSNQYLKRKQGEIKGEQPNVSETGSPLHNKRALHNGLFTIMVVYFFATAIVLVIPYNLPFLLQNDHFKSDISGALISTFFTAMMLPGLMINRLIKWLSKQLITICFFGIAIGLIFLTLSRHWLFLAAGVAVTGFCYGTIQPFLYEKTVATSANKRATFSLALMMSMNYTAIVLAPWVFNKIPLLMSSSNGIPLSFWIASIMALTMSTLSLGLNKRIAF